MCGIAGIFHLDGQPCDPSDIIAITDALAHRGPDGRGIYTDGPLGLGHRRLAIVDLSDAGKQPMSPADGRYWITYNGEVYNFVELRHELEALGQRFVSESDTEVIVAAYRHWGPDCVLKFNGMWTFAIWDAEHRELFLSVDRFGIKPLNYLAEPRRFAFASEIKAFRFLRGFSARENESVLRRALALGTEPVEDTLLQGVKRLRAGHNMLVNDSGVKVWRWWRTLDHLPTVPRRFSEQTEQFRELFFDSCALRLRSDVPVATCLSGGLDSSSIACALGALRGIGAGSTERRTNDYHRAFVAAFPGTPWDERSFADAAIERAGAEARYRTMTPELAVENLRQYAYDFENIGGALLIPLWLIYRELRRDGVVVSLDGHGGDELLGGYAYTVEAELRVKGLFRAPLRSISLFRTLVGMYDTGPFGNEYLRDFVVSNDPFLRVARGAMQKAARLTRKVGGYRRRPVTSVAKPAFIEPFGEPDLAMEADEAAAIEGLGPINRALYQQFHHTVLPSILRKFDRCSMAHGVEIRMPFMDWRLVCYAFALPETSKVGAGVGKRILRESMRGVLPEKVRIRKDKIGFVSPLPNWFNGSLGDWIWDQVRSPLFLESEIWDGPAIRDFVAPRHQAKSWAQAECNMVWRYLQAHLWRQEFFP